MSVIKIKLKLVYLRQKNLISPSLCYTKLLH